MKIISGILLLIAMLMAPLTVFAEDRSGGDSNKVSAEPSADSGSEQEPDSEDEEPDCD